MWEAPPTHAPNTHAPCTHTSLVIGDKPFKIGLMKRLLPFLLLLISSAGLAESGAYRVEVIVVRNLEVVAEAMVVEELRSFSHFPGLEESQPPIDLPEGPPDELPPRLPNDLSALLRINLPDDLYVVTRKGTYMDDVWRRLRSSQGYRPLVYTAWEQNRVDYYPPMRIHDQQIIDTQLRPPTNIMLADLAAEDPLAAYRSNFYQLDGSVQLKRSRFLHLLLDLEYRVDMPRTGTETNFFTESKSQTGTFFETENSTDRGIFTLKQNRQIRTAQLQYFDTPYLGALVLVTAIQAD